MKQYSKVIIKAIIIILLGALLGVLWLSYNIPIQNSLVELRKVATDINQKRIKLIDHITGLSMLSQDQENIRDLANRAKSLVPEKSGVVDFLLQLEEMVKSIGLEPVELNVAESEKKDPSAQTSSTAKDADGDEKGPIQSSSSNQTQTAKSSGSALDTADFSISFKGTFSHIQQFLSLLKTVDRFNTVETISITYGPDGLIATFSGTIYSQKIPQFSINAEDSVTALDDQAKDLLGRKHFGDPLLIPTTPPDGSSDPFGKLTSR